MKIIDLQRESITLNDVIELARHDPVSILTSRGEEVYVTHLGQSELAPTDAGPPGPGTLTQAEVEEAIEKELARLDGHAFTGDK